ncbi:DUF4349 domain-containing protein [Ornithinimicrobium pekingense]|uniref:Lipoprotein n=1 Tax=Ornithinimicrobium pekingense TaxID=384677 RepID=A0ABQ2F7X3_9MICO|nr:DUF4349 domain-containing protein [Ornithinimicrobium pekingense]GGK70700.1 lipoprotein [Ornithinimicrobium pekingense]
MSTTAHRSSRPAPVPDHAPPHRRRRSAVLALVTALALLVLGACSSADLAEPGAGGSDSAGQAAMPADGAEEAGAADLAEGDDSAVQDPGADVLVPGSAPAGEGALMVRTVTVEVLVEDVLAAVSRARAAAVTVDGWVSTEEVRPGRGEGTGREAGWATVVLRVPSEDLDAVVSGLADLGEVTSSRSSSEDVTTEYRDVEARVATLEAGAQRLRELVEEAGSVESIAGLERELSAREADLDALKARMKVLAEDVSMSTVTLHLAEDAATLAETVPDDGFLAGLRQGWDAFAGSVTLLLTALGAVLPFVMVAALLALPVLAWRRRRRSRPVAPDATGGTGGAAGAAASD